jgi:hypothetical protein
VCSSDLNEFGAGGQGDGSTLVKVQTLPIPTISPNPTPSPTPTVPEIAYCTLTVVLVFGLATVFALIFKKVPHVFFKP